MSPIEGKEYYYSLDFYTEVTLYCTYNEEGIAWLKHNISDEVTFKYIIRTGKLYKWASDSWELTEYELKEKSYEDIWSNRKSF